MQWNTFDCTILKIPRTISWWSFSITSTIMLGIRFKCLAHLFFPCRSFIFEIGMNCASAFCVGLGSVHRGSCRWQELVGWKVITIKGFLLLPLLTSFWYINYLWFVLLSFLGIVKFWIYSILHCLFFLINYQLAHTHKLRCQKSEISFWIRNDVLRSRNLFICNNYIILCFIFLYHHITILIDWNVLRLVHWISSCLFFWNVPSLNAKLDLIVTFLIVTFEEFKAPLRRCLPHLKQFSLRVSFISFLNTLKLLLSFYVWVLWAHS